MKYYNSMGQEVTESVTNQFNGLQLIKLDLQQTIEQNEQQINILTTIIANQNLKTVELQKDVEKLENQIKTLKKKRKRRKPNVN